MSWEDDQLVDVPDYIYEKKQPRGKMSQKVTGAISAYNKNKVGKYAYKIGDKWYGTNSTEQEFQKDEVIEFEFEQNGVFNNILKGTVKKIANNAPLPNPNVTVNRGDAPKVDWDKKDRKIVRQHSQEMALRFAELLLSQGAVAFTAKSDKVAVLEQLVDHYTDRFQDQIINIDGVGQDRTERERNADLSGEEE